MLKSALMQWSAETLVQRMKANVALFDNTIQRKLVWDIRRKSLLIASMIEGYPIPPLYAVKHGKQYDMLDGKQRSHAIKEYIDGKFALVGIPKVKYENYEENLTGAQYETKVGDFNRVRFNDLPESVQKQILNYSLTVHYFDSITDDEAKEMFFRLNNGKTLSSIELNRAKAVSIDVIRRLSSHQLFVETLKVSQFNKYINEDLVIKAWGVLFVKDISFIAGFIRPLLETEEIKEDQAVWLEKVFDRILSVHKYLKRKPKTNNDKKAISNLTSLIMKPTHFASLVSVVNKSLEDSMSAEILAEWIEMFYTSKSGTSINEKYNQLVKAGTGKAYIIRERNQIVIDSFTEYVSTKNGIDN